MTADELALLRGVEAAPDDDLPRLVYADWLDEQGRHARAEFIRVQCELASINRRLYTMTLDEKLVEGPRRGKLLHLQKTMLTDDPIACLGLPPVDWQDDVSDWWDWGHSFIDSFERGFSKELTLTAGQYLGSALRLAHGTTPQPYIKVCRVDSLLRSEVGLAILRNGVLWAGVKELYFNEPRTQEYRPGSLLPHELIPIMQPDFPSLRVFMAVGCEFNPGHVCVIAERLKAPGLEDLVLYSNDIVDSGVAFLHRAIYAKSLKQLCLGSNPLCRPHVRTLTADRFPSLRRIDLSNCPVMPESIVQLKAQLPAVEVVMERW